MTTEPQKQKGPEDHAPRSEKDSEKGHDGTNKTYVVNMIVRQIGSRLRLRSVVRWYGYSKADDTAKPPPSRPQHTWSPYGCVPATIQYAKKEDGHSASLLYNDIEHALPLAPLQSTTLKEQTLCKLLKQSN